MRLLGTIEGLHVCGERGDEVDGAWLGARAYVTDGSAVRYTDADSGPAHEEERPRMDIASHDEIERTVARALGEELRRARSEVGWTRAELVERMRSEIHARTLANYEQGSRQCTVARFVEICEALGVAAPDVLGLALQRAKVQLLASSIQVDLQAVLNDTSTKLEPLRRWARNRLASNQNDRGVARLPKAAVHDMAALLDITDAELVEQLVRFTPETVTRVRDSER